MSLPPEFAPQGLASGLSVQIRGKGFMPKRFGL